MESFDVLQDLAGLESAEEFLEYFGIAYQADVVAVRRLHILQRFHDYLNRQDRLTPLSFVGCKDALAKAYDDFVHSDAITEKVFRVHQRAAGLAFVPVASIGRGVRK